MGSERAVTPLKWAVLIGVAPIVLAFIAGFFRIDVGLSWAACITWLVLALIVGAGVAAAQKRRS